METNKIILRPYQQDCVAKGLDVFKRMAREVLVVPTGAGKTHILTTIAKQLEGKTIIFSPSKEILEQSLDKMKAIGETDIGVFSASMNEKTIGKITFATIGTIYNKPEMWDMFDYCIIDECFTGEVEVLTDKGFIRFDKLNKTEKIAQWENEKISFVKPLRHIKRKHNGEITLFKVKHNLCVPMTNNHIQPLKSTRTGILNRRTISECKFGNDWVLPVSGKSKEKSNNIKPIERFFIALQADGSIRKRYNGYTTTHFQFKKERKIKRFLKIVKDSGLDISEVKCAKKQYRGFLVKVPDKIKDNLTKNLHKNIAFPMSYNKAKDIIEEMVEWDGHMVAGGRQYYFSSKDKRQVDFYFQVAILAGHRCYQSIEKDGRKKTYSDIYRLYVTKNKIYDSSYRCKTSKIQYSGNVYCVEVPSHNIIIRYKGFSFVTGNCDLVNSKEGMYNEFIETHGGSVLGLTATPFRMSSYNDMETGYRVVVAKFLTRTRPKIFNKIAHTVQIKDIKDKYWSPLEYLINEKYKPDEVKLNTTGMDFDDNALRTYNSKMNIIEVIKDSIKTLDKRHILVFTRFVEEAVALQRELNNLGITSGVVSADTPKKEREYLVADFKSGKIKVVLNVGIFLIGFDFPELDCVIVGRPLMSVRSWYQICLDEKTEILTKTGWKTNKDIKYSDEIASVNYTKSYDAPELNWEKPQQITKRKTYPGERFVSINTPSLDIRVTEDHEMLVGNRQVRVKKWKKESAFKMANRKNGFQIPVSAIEKTKGLDLTDDEIRFIGWFLTDGSLNKSNNVIAISQSTIQPHFGEIEKMLKGCGFKFGKSLITSKTNFKENAPRYLFRISKGKPIGTDKHLSGWGRLEKYIDKNIPESLQDINERQFEILLETMHLGDGAKQLNQYWTRRSYHISKGNKIFADNLQSLCLRRGWRCNISVDTKGRDKPLYYIHIKKTTKRAVGGYNQKDRGCFVVEEKPKEENVWCVKVPSGAFIARRNGKSFITGNCGRAVRPHPDKQKATIIDICGNMRRFGRVETFEYVENENNGLPRLKSEVGFLTGVNLVNGKDLEEVKIGDTITFGKFKGKKIKDIDLGYLQWGAENLKGAWKKRFEEEVSLRKKL